MTQSNEDFRAMCQRQLGRMSDQAIRFQLTRSVGGIEGEEIQAEAARRGVEPREAGGYAHVGTTPERREAILEQMARRYTEVHESASELDEQ